MLGGGGGVLTAMDMTNTVHWKETGIQVEMYS
jgi:hypothetical protein